MPAHRDLNEEQVLVDPARPDDARHWVDWDQASFAPAGLDLGNLLAHERLRALRRGDDAGALDPPPRAAVVAAYREAGGRARRRVVGAWEAVACLRLAALARDPAVATAAYRNPEWVPLARRGCLTGGALGPPARTNRGAGPRVRARKEAPMKADRIHRGVGSTLVVAVLALGGCSDNNTNVINPAFQPEVTNNIDNFQFQATNMTNVTQVLTYSWRNTGTQANVDQSCSITAGTATLTLSDSTGHAGAAREHGRRRLRRERGRAAGGMDDPGDAPWSERDAQLPGPEEDLKRGDGRRGAPALLISAGIG